jgi:UDP-glucose 4-epimerase
VGAGSIGSHTVKALLQHLAAHAFVEESFNKADEYHDNNVNSTLALLKTCARQNVKRFIISSSSTIYGNANKKQKLSEKHNISAVSHYGK